MNTTISVSKLLDLVNDLADAGRCHYDHHGYCQEHGWFKTDIECPHARAQRLWDMNGKPQVDVKERQRGGESRAN